MTEKMQADGAGTTPNPADDNGEVASRRGADQKGESQGGAYPNPHTGKDGSPEGPDKFMGHGGQTDIDDHGTGQLGADKTGDDPNAPTRGK
ncbi:hypothetical protein [uncultured Sphingomonas sp.]|uniref:hypothetical protein n=1 Tax=uncultured Sphingomonas sp. TaxID=158754 RepID=UPI0025DD5049|nr:hypothetical protein [uncultured Sphingomonas sp.]